MVFQVFSRKKKKKKEKSNGVQKMRSFSGKSQGCFASPAPCWAPGCILPCTGLGTCRGFCFLPPKILSHPTVSLQGKPELLAAHTVGTKSDQTRQSF